GHCWPPLACTRRCSRCGAGPMRCSAGWSRAAWECGEMNELEQLVDDIGQRSFDARLGRRGFPDSFDEELWRNLEDTGLSRVPSGADCRPRGLVTAPARDRPHT